MDPRRRIDDKHARISTSRVPFVETYREIVFEEQALGKSLEREIIVIRIDRSTLKLYAFLSGVILLTVLITIGVGILGR